MSGEEVEEEDEFSEDFSQILSLVRVIEFVNKEFKAPLA